MSAAASWGDVSALLGIAGIVGAVLAVVLTSGARESLRLLRGDRDDLRERVATLEGKENDCQARLARIEAENGVLRDMVTGQSAIAALGAQIEGHYRDLVTRLSDRT